MLSDNRLWPLLCVVPAACSDDETEPEDNSADTASANEKALHIRRLPWRSEELENVMKHLDQRKVQGAESLNSPTRGRRARPRIRSHDAPDSVIEAPSGLAIDCYSKEYLDKIGPGGQAKLEIKPQPILQSILRVLL